MLMLRRLLAWSLTSEDFYTVRIPNKLKFASARDEHVGLITRSNQLLLWSVGGSLLSIERSGIEQWEECTPNQFIFHPLHYGHFFIFYSDSRGSKLMVEEFIDGNYHTTQYVYSTLD
jgi:hypothetical protein